MSDLVAFLKARLDEDEQAAKAAEGHSLFDGTGIVSGRNASVVLPSHVAIYVARHDPARVLREVESKRRIIELHRSVRVRSTGSAGGTIEDCQMCDHFPAQYPCLTLRLLALPYADHSDYREEWRHALT